MNPPTAGHAKLIQKVQSLAPSKSEARIYLSQSQDNRKNPLPFPEKVKLVQSMFPKVTVPMDRNAKTIFHVMKILVDEGYKDITLVVGDDRVSEFRNTISKYIKKSTDSDFNPTKHYDIDKFTVVSAGARDPDAEGVEGMSASKMRDFVKTGDIDSFVKGFPVSNVSLARKVFASLKRHLKESVEPIALFISGGPGSGKDILIKEFNDTHRLKEVEPKDLSGTVTQNLIINGKPEDFDRPKVYLEDLGYSTAYINVIIDEEVSKNRNIFRSRPLSEEKRQEKLSEYNRSAKKCSNLFEITHTFNNSVDYNANPEHVQEQIEEIKTELNEKMLDALKDWLKDTNSPLSFQRIMLAYFKRIDQMAGKKNTMSNSALAAEVAQDHGMNPRKFVDWIRKNTKILGIDRKYMVESEINDEFEELLESGAGFWGTPELTKKVASMTPGQEKFKLPNPKGDKYNEPRAKVYGTYIKTLKGKYPGPIKESYEELTSHVSKIESKLKDIGDKLNKYPKGSTGLTHDDAKDATWKKLRADQASHMKALQKANGFILKNYKKEAKAARDLRRSNRQIKESVGAYADERAARKYAYEAAITQMDPWTTIHVVQHRDETYSVIKDINLKSKTLPGDKSVASYTSSEVKNGNQKDPSSIPQSFKSYLGHKGI